MLIWLKKVEHRKLKKKKIKLKLKLKLYIKMEKTIIKFGDKEIKK